MRVAVVGATGLIGSAVAAARAAHEAVSEVVRGSRSAGVPVDIRDASSIAHVLETVGPIDAVVCCAGRLKHGDRCPTSRRPNSLGSLHEKLLGQIMLTKLAIPHLLPWRRDRADRWAAGPSRHRGEYRRRHGERCPRGVRKQGRPRDAKRLSRGGGQPGMGGGTRHGCAPTHAGR